MFVSYSRHDERLVKPLAGLIGLASEEAVFLDVEQLKPGDRWETKLINAIRQSSVFVLCWCCRSEKSEFVRKEIALALQSRQKKVVPVLFCSAPLPRDISEWQWIDLKGRVCHECEHLGHQTETVNKENQVPEKIRIPSRLHTAGLIVSAVLLGLIAEIAAQAVKIIKTDGLDYKDANETAENPKRGQIANRVTKMLKPNESEILKERIVSYFRSLEES